MSKPTQPSVAPQASAPVHGDASGSTGESSQTPLTYKDSGVDIAAADGFVARIAALAAGTHGPSVLGGRGEYASLFRPSIGGVRDPLLAATCDGVGTKLLVALQMGQLEGLGQDLVAMNVNDLVAVGARPLFFLDYIAAGKLDSDQLEAVVRGIAKACERSGCALLGGETAEMPGLYAPGHFDLAGFAVGMADGSRLLGAHTEAGDKVRPGDKVLALPSSGVHSNGFSLARKALFDRAGLSPQACLPELGGQSLGQALLAPTRLYVREMMSLLEHVPVKDAAHITGGGLLGRAERLVGPGQRLVIDPARFERPAIFDVIQRAGEISSEEMAKTFNMGLGFVVVLSPGSASRVRDSLQTRWLEVGGIVEAETGVDLGFATSH